MGNKQSSRQGANASSQKTNKMDKKYKDGKSDVATAKRKKLDYSVNENNPEVAQICEGFLQEDRTRRSREP
jgi:hypothetical protein